jgi:hypothetical protein
MGKRIWTLTILIYLTISVPARAQDARIADVIVTNTRDHLIVYFSIQGWVTEELDQAILSGAPTSFTFLVSLNRVRDFWIDKNLAHREVRHTIKFDNLKHIFTISRSEDDGKEVAVNSFEEAKKIMAEVENLILADLGVLESGNRYQVRIKAELSRITLPFYLHHVFRFFLFLWDFETDWYATDFMY